MDVDLPSASDRHKAREMGCPCQRSILVLYCIMHANTEICKYANMQVYLDLDLEPLLFPQFGVPQVDLADMYCHRKKTKKKENTTKRTKNRRFCC
mmetsp:Transcript_18097/g.31399  ORF Transcript_18097/g.31399 Transcript_18097/m.31399 type:complete len:95 (+) Transcript_18097:145-429(+)